jgi:ABC-type uncharacterized transport system ATPase subunit
MLELSHFDKDKPTEVICPKCKSVTKDLTTIRATPVKHSNLTVCFLVLKSDFRRARLGLTIKFQNIRVYQDLTVFQNLFIPARRHHRPSDIQDQVARLLAHINLEGTEDALVRNLSHGQQQWLSIGMSLAVDPEVLLMDEPTAGLSVKETKETANIIRNLRDRGITVIVIEHDMEFVRNLDTVTSVLHLGRLFAQDSFAAIEASEDVRRIYLGAL